MIEAAIKSERIIFPGSCRDGVLLLKNGRILDVVSEIPSGDFPVTDCGNAVLMAGIVDPHVHINEPGRTAWEGFDTGTKAAIAGGVTSLIDMPLNASPVTTTVAALKKKIKSTTGQLHANCGFWGGLVPGNENEIIPLIENGVPGFKAFLIHSGIDEFPNISENDLRKAMQVIAKYNLPVLVHCELTDSSNDASHVSSASYSNYLASRPKKWEDDAINLMIRLCTETNCRTHIVHLSSASSIEQIHRAKQKGLSITVETGQHYLYFDAAQISDGRTEYKCAPPIREKENNELLWAALKKGIIDFVATDHSPALPELKEQQSGDFMKAWGGIASLQFALPALWTAAKKRSCSINDIAKWLCENPALLPGLKTKGKIAKGMDADFVIWQPEKTFTVTEEMILHKHKLTPYLGQKLYGLVEQSWLAGKPVYSRGNFLHLNSGKILFNDFLNEPTTAI
jgi:allantoinase